LRYRVAINSANQTLNIWVCSWRTRRLKKEKGHLELFGVVFTGADTVLGADTLDTLSGVVRSIGSSVTVRKHRQSI